MVRACFGNIFLKVIKMKRLLAFVIVIIAVAVLWYFSMPMMAEKISLINSDTGSLERFSGISSLFSALALASIVFIVCVQALDAKENQISLDKTLMSNKLHLEVIALTSLINECDMTLHRYDRWEKAGIKGDYTNSKAGVRDKMNAYRKKLEQTYEEIQFS